jgi:hypothetical protein
VTYIETAFLCALFVMYLYDCVYWLAPDEQAFTRTSGDGWKTWQREPMSFTLLGRTPVVAAPLLVRPGFIRARGTRTKDSERILRKVGRHLHSLELLLVLCRTQAILLLLYLPALILLHRLDALWPYFLGVVAFVHLLLCFFAVRALRRTKSGSWKTAATSIALNPLGATRSFDAISQALFDQAIQTRGIKLDDSGV